MRIRYPIFMCLGLLAAAQANAEEGFFSDSSILGGISVGQLSLDNSAFVGPPGAFVGPPGLKGFESTGTAWAPFVGFEFNRYLSVEVSRFNGGTPSQSKLVSAPSAGSLVPGVYTTETDNFGNSGWLGSAMGSFPINEVVSVYARGGMLSWKTKIRFERKDELVDPVTNQLLSTTYQYFQANDTGNDPFYGFGVAVNIDSGIVRLEYDLSKIDAADVRYISLAVVWRFKPWSH